MKKDSRKQLVENLSDPEERREVSDAERVYMLTQHEGWGIVDTMLLAEVKDLESIQNIPSDAKTVEDIVNDIRSRKAAIEILMDWRRKVLGIAEAYEADISGFRQNQDHIRVFT